MSDLFHAGNLGGNTERRFVPCVRLLPYVGAGLFCLEVIVMSVRLSKEESEKLLDKRKDTVRKVCLEKTDLTGLTSRVAVVLDVSHSMASAFESGMVQATLERLLPLAMAFDDDGSMEMWTFDHEFRRYPPLNKANFYNYIKENNIHAQGGTYYSRVMADVGVYFSKEEPARLPTYVIFITDGDNADVRATNMAICHVSYFPIFFQFVGIGNTSPDAFKYLKTLDDMEGRYVDNANFFAIESLADIDIISDSELYSKLLNEYPKWLGYPEVKEMIENAPSLHKTRRKHIKKLKQLSAQDPLDNLSFSRYARFISKAEKIVDLILKGL